MDRMMDLELEALMKLKDEDIDTSDIPEVTDWSNAVVGKYAGRIIESRTVTDSEQDSPSQADEPSS